MKKRMDLFMVKRFGFSNLIGNGCKLGNFYNRFFSITRHFGRNVFFLLFSFKKTYSHIAAHSFLEKHKSYVAMCFLFNLLFAVLLLWVNVFFTEIIYSKVNLS